LMLLLPLPFRAVGGGGLAYTVLNWGKSVERRAVLAQRTAQLDPLKLPGDPAPRLPTVPAAGDVINSPGTRLKFRLPNALPPWRAMGLLLACLGWNGVVLLAATLVVRRQWKGEADWTASLVLVPFEVVGVALIVLLVRRMFAATSVGPTIVEISSHPLYPGQEYEIFVAQAGRMQLESFKVTLICAEEATYRQGTNTRSELVCVHEAEILTREQVDVIRDQPFEARCTISIPFSAMHSFQSPHNKISWQIVVEGVSPGWPRFQRGYLIHVHPLARGTRP